MITAKISNIIEQNRIYSKPQKQKVIPQDLSYWVFYLI